MLTPVMGNAASETGKAAICLILPSLRAFSASEKIAKSAFSDAIR